MKARILKKNNVMRMLNFYRFRKKTDDLGVFGIGNTFYYKEVSHKEYLVFNYFPKSSFHIEAFDCYLVGYDKRTHVGSQKPVSIKILKLSFKIENDFHLIGDMLEQFMGRTNEMIKLEKSAV